MADKLTKEQEDELAKEALSLKVKDADEVENEEVEETVFIKKFSDLITTKQEE